MTEISREIIADRNNYKFWTSVNLRYGDTDKLGHVNNAVFATLCESGRSHLLFNRHGSIAGAGKTIVLANLNLDYLNEMHFPGDVEVGTALDSFGKSSLRLFQCLYKDGMCCGISRSTMVLIDEVTRKSIPYPDEIRKAVEAAAPFLYKAN